MNLLGRNAGIIQAMAGLVGHNEGDFPVIAKEINHAGRKTDQALAGIRVSCTSVPGVNSRALYHHHADEVLWIETLNQWRYLLPDPFGLLRRRKLCIPEQCAAFRRERLGDLVMRRLRR